MYLVELGSMVWWCLGGVASKVQWCGSGGGGGLVVWLVWCCGVLLFRLVGVV